MPCTAFSYLLHLICKLAKRTISSVADMLPYFVTIAINVTLTQAAQASRWLIFYQPVKHWLSCYSNTKL